MLAILQIIGSFSGQWFCFILDGSATLRLYKIPAEMVLLTSILL